MTIPERLENIKATLHDSMLTSEEIEACIFKCDKRLTDGWLYGGYTIKGTFKAGRLVKHVVSLSFLKMEPDGSVTSENVPI